MSDPATSIESQARVIEVAGPRHVAIIMDGNGRWAKARGLPRAAGHREGVEALRRVVEACRELGVEHLTVFSFSTENWRRPPSEISALFDLLRLYVARDLARLRQEGVRIRIIGSREGLEPDLLRIIDECVTTTGHNTAFNLNIAFNYGGRAEIVEAVRAAARAVSRGEIAPDAIDESFLSACLWTRDLPDPDLLIRTSGEQRISNFLLWGCAYTEIVFMEERWPDFDRGCMERALDVFRSRQRRFGGVGA